MHVYAFSTINNKNLILKSRVLARNASVAVVAATRVANAGLAHDRVKTAVVTAYLRMSG